MVGFQPIWMVTSKLNRFLVKVEFLSSGDCFWLTFFVIMSTLSNELLNIRAERASEDPDVSRHSDSSAVTREYMTQCRNGNCHFSSNYFRLCYFQVAEDHAEFESSTSLRKQQYNFIRNAGFTKRLELGKQMYLTFRPNCSHLMLYTSFWIFTRKIKVTSASKLAGTRLL